MVRDKIILRQEIKIKRPIVGACNRLVRELGLSAQLKREYGTEINSAGDYQSRLTIMQKWFGIVFVGGQ